MAIKVPTHLPKVPTLKMKALITMDNLAQNAGSGDPGRTPSVSGNPDGNQWVSPQNSWNYARKTAVTRQWVTDQSSNFSGANGIGDASPSGPTKNSNLSNKINDGVYPATAGTPHVCQ
jgi:hypothetical protein